MSGVLLAVVLATGPTGWTDTSTVTAAPASAAAVPAPVLRCTGGIGGVVFSWDAVPGATSYTLYTGPDGDQPTSVSDTSAVVPGLVGSGTARVRAEVAYPAVTWTSALSGARAYTVFLVGRC